MSVAGVHALPHHLSVLPDAKNDMKAEMHGLPLFSTDPALRDLAVTMATDLASLATLDPVPPAN